MPALLSNINDWFNTNVVDSAVWSVVGLLAVALTVLYFVALLLKLLVGLIAGLRVTMASRKRRDTQGFGIAVAPLVGAKGPRQTKAIIEALEQNLELFTFGSPFEIVRAPRLQIKGARGLRAAATDWLAKSSTDLVLWGHLKSRKEGFSSVEILSLGGSLPPSDAMHSEGVLPLITRENEAITSRVVAYLIARALQPGLADGTAFKAEKLEPVAGILKTCLDDGAALPERTRLTLETDYCSMALALSQPEHLSAVAEFRRRRLAGGETMGPEHEVQARIDLGRALLLQAQNNFDPVRVREAMDHLKVAVEILKSDPVLRLAQATNTAVKQGQTMLANQKRFSVTGGSTL